MATTYENATPKWQARMDKLATQKKDRARKAARDRARRMKKAPRDAEWYSKDISAHNLRDQAAHDAWYNDATLNPGYAERQAEGQSILDRKAEEKRRLAAMMPDGPLKTAAMRKANIENQARRTNALDQVRRDSLSGYGPASPKAMRAAQFGLGVGSRIEELPMPPGNYWQGPYIENLPMPPGSIWQDPSIEKMPWISEPGIIWRGPYTDNLPWVTEPGQQRPPGGNVLLEREMFSGRVGPKAAGDYRMEAIGRARAMGQGVQTDEYSFMHGADAKTTADFYKDRLRKHANSVKWSKREMPTDLTPEQEAKIEAEIERRMSEYRGQDLEASRKRDKKTDEARARREISAMIGDGEYSDVDIAMFMNYLEDPEKWANEIMRMPGVSEAVKARIRANAQAHVDGLGRPKRGMFVDPALPSPDQAAADKRAAEYTGTGINTRPSIHDLTPEQRLRRANMIKAQQEAVRSGGTKGLLAQKLMEMDPYQSPSPDSQVGGPNDTRAEDYRAERERGRWLAQHRRAENARNNPWASGVYAGRGGTQADIEAGYGSSPVQTQPGSSTGTYTDPATGESQPFPLQPIDQWFSQHADDPSISGPLSKINDEIESVENDKRYRDKEKAARIAELNKKKRELADKFGYSTDPSEEWLAAQQGGDEDAPESTDLKDAVTMGEKYEAWVSNVWDANPDNEGKEKPIFEDWLKTQDEYRKIMDKAKGIGAEDAAGGGAGGGAATPPPEPQEYSGSAKEDDPNFPVIAFDEAVSKDPLTAFYPIKKKDGTLVYPRPGTWTNEQGQEYGWKVTGESVTTYTPSEGVKMQVPGSTETATPVISLFSREEMKEVAARWRYAGGDMAKVYRQLRPNGPYGAVAIVQGYKELTYLWVDPPTNNAGGGS